MGDAEKTVYCTKYVDTRGILELDLIEHYPDKKMALARIGKGIVYLHGQDFHFTLEDAVERAKVVISNKKKALARKIAELQAFDFGKVTKL